MKAGILEKITYPAGGSTVFAYEAHRLLPTDTKIYGGLRIKFVTSFTADGIQATKNEYVYNQGQYFGDEPESGNYYRLNVRSSLNGQQLVGLDPAGGTPGYSKISTSLVYFSASPFRPLYGYHFGYTSVTVKRLDASTSTYSYLFPNYISNAQGSVNYPYPANVGVQDNIMMTREEHKNAAGTIVQSTDFNYQFDEVGRINARKYYFYPWGNVSLYFRSNYQLVQYRKLLKSTTEYLDGVTKTITYGYRTMDYAHLNPISVTTTGSTGDITQVCVKFPADIDVSHPNYANVSTFLNRNMTGIPCETREYYNGNLVHGDRVEYQTIPHISGAYNIFIPYKYYRINRDCGIELLSTITKTDPDGKPTQVTHTGYNNTKYFYYQTNNLLFRQTTRTSTDSLSQSIVYDGTSSLPKTVTDVNGLLKKFTYDPLMRMSKLQDRMDASGNDVQATIDYNYQFGVNLGSFFNFVGTTLTVASGSSDPAKVLSSKQYTDGLDRPVEVVKENYINITTTNHQKTFMNYDALGRPNLAYQPFESSTLGYEAPAANAPNKHPIYETSPLSRPLTQIAEDNSTVQIAYAANVANEVFQFCTPAVAASNCNPPGSIAPPVCTSISVNGYYAANALMKTTVTNENGKTTDVYTDKLGRVILMRKHLNGQNIDTYNVYNDFSDLIMVIPPGGIDAGNNIVTNICYNYTYDIVGRLCTKKIPGAEALNYYYDNRDLVTLMQDGNMRKTIYGGLDNGTKYLATKYDDFGRTYLTGWYYASVGENMTTTAASGNINVQSSDILTQNIFYPNSTWIKHNAAKVLYAPGTFVTGMRNNIWSYSERRSTLNYKGNPVWQGRQHLLSLNQPERPINDATDWNGIDWSVSVYNGAQQPNYASRVLASNNATQNVNAINYFRYDNGLRLDNINYSYNPQGQGSTPLKTLANMVYDFRDQLIQKNIGKGDANSDANNNYLQNIDYLYNVRGWLTNINTFNVPVNSFLLPIPTSTMTGPKTTSGMLGVSLLQNAIAATGNNAAAAPPPNQIQGNKSNDLFYEEIRYNNPYNTTGVPGQLNGNISAVSWQIAGRDKQAYGYRYDDLDRLTQADYYDIQDPSSASVWSTFSADNKFQEKQTYDVRGNITSLQRRGMLSGSMTVNGQAAGTFGLIDDLSYTYQSGNLNRLATITDAASTTVGFTTTTGTGAANAYEYDDNGNLKKDLNKGITNILYNYINLPMVITFANGNQLLFTYDAAGTKLIKARSNYYPGINPIVNNDRYYVGGVEYVNSPGGTYAHPETALIDIIPNAEGYAKRDVSGNYTDNYILRDHLGNTRVVFSDKNNDGLVDATDIVQVNAYYPFGLNHGANVNGAGGSFKYQYNSKELNDDWGLNWNDYGARWYDPAIGRWHATDPLAEATIDQSPYHYVSNNPVGYTDPDGMIKSVCPCHVNQSSGDDGGTGGGDNGVADAVSRTMGGGLTGNAGSGGSSGGSSPVQPTIQHYDYIFNATTNKYTDRTLNTQFYDRLVVMNYNSGQAKAYQFADPVNDPLDIFNKKITKFVYVSLSDISNMIREQGGFDSENGGINKFGEKSTGGQPFDYSYKVIPKKYPEASSFPLEHPSPLIFIPVGDKYAHNHMNFGNFLWGATGYTLGFGERTLKGAAHYNSLKNPGPNGYDRQFDSADDQFSISRGVNYARYYNFRNQVSDSKTVKKP